MAGYELPGVDNTRGWRWYKGDLHLHTIYSDGTWNACQLLQVAREWGLDFIAITDHNSVQAYPEALACGFALPLVIPGVELGKAGGHAVALRIQELVYYRDKAEDWNMREAAEAVHAAGGIFYIAHPYTDAPDCRWRHPLILDECDALEIWNGEPWIEDGNDQSLETWHAYLNAGHRLPGVAGSDAHRMEHLRPGTAFNHVYAPELSQEAVLTSILAGRLFLSNGPWVWIEARSVENPMWMTVGDSLPLGRGMILRITWGEVPPDSVVKVCHNGLTIHAQDAHRAGQFLLGDTPLSEGWCTVEVWSAEGSLLATTNPLYLVGH